MSDFNVLNYSQYEQEMTNQMNLFFEQNNIQNKFHAQWYQAPKKSKVITETDNKVSDILIHNVENESKNFFIECKSSRTAQIFNASVKKDQTFNVDNIECIEGQNSDDENSKFYVLKNIFIENEIEDVNYEMFELFSDKVKIKTSLLSEMFTEMLHNKNELFVKFFSDYIKEHKDNLTNALQINNIVEAWKNFPEREKSNCDICSITIVDCAETIRKHYKSKNAKYIIIEGKMFILDKSDNPLDISLDINNGGIQDISVFKKVICELRFRKDRKGFRITTRCRLDNKTVTDFNSYKIDMYNNDTFPKLNKHELKENLTIPQNEEDLIELNKKFGNESYLIDEIETSKTESNKFEVEISNKIREFLDSQSDEKYKKLQVGHYEESDSKYHSDVFITNPVNDKQVWVEVKKNKYANLGGLSFKYNEGNWTCTTTNEDDPLTNFYLTALNQNSEKFTSFCKDYLKKDDIKLPKDITDDLIDAWKVSGNITDTDNETQFITDKIPLEDFGFLISKFYQTAKNEPVYYIQVGDDLYIIDSNYNPLNLMAKSGSELKSLSEAYRIGRIQFRIKTMNKNGVRYFSIVNDIKILSDKENLDTDYSCSFDTKEKWPVIKGSEITESNEELKLLCNIPEDTIQNIIDNTQIENKRFERSQFTKYFGIKETNWCILASKDKNLAIAAINNNTPFNDYYFITEIQTLKKGYGKILIEELIKKYKKVWLMANTKAGEDLMNYYRKLKLNEIIIPNSVYGCPAYFYCTDDCDFDKLENYIIAFYSNEEELDEAEKDIGGDASNEIPEEGLKIWIDDIREAPEGFKWFKKVTDFVNWVYSRGTLDDVSLIDTDHDAGEYQEFGGDYVKIFDYLDKSGVKNLTIHIHSANPVGANNIRNIISKNKENGWKEIRN